MAHEVKELANQTSKSTEDIRSRISSLREKMGGIVSSMQEGAQAVQEGRSVVDNLGDQLQTIADNINAVTARMGEISNILSQQTEAANDVSEGTTKIAAGTENNNEEVDRILDGMDALNALLAEQIGSFADLGMDRAVIEIARNDHILFKKRIVDTLVGRDNGAAESVPDEHNCRLGKWYDRVENPHLRETDSFQKMVEPHHRVHDLGRRVLEAHKARDENAALDLLERLNDASHEVVKLLEDLSKVAENLENEEEATLRSAAE